MIHEIHDEMVHVDLRNGKLRLCIELSNADDGEKLEALDAAVDAWDGDEQSGVDCFFTLTEILDSSIEMHQIPANENRIDIDAKPLFDAMRAELSEMIQRIDAIKYA